MWYRDSSEQVKLHKGLYDKFYVLDATKTGNTKSPYVQTTMASQHAGQNSVTHLHSP